ncbi:MAG: hypothetical protein SFW35_09435 [Chitinophagales bacterium]|nr:hypothetical protein [Chitinophagales bacterium]
MKPFLVIIFLLSTTIALAQDSSVIHVYRLPKHKNGMCPTEFTLPRQDKMTLYKSSEINYTIYSEGAIFFDFKTVCPGFDAMPGYTYFAQLSLNVQHGQEYYFVIDASYRKDMAIIVKKEEYLELIEKDKNLSRLTYQESKKEPIK